MMRTADAISALRRGAILMRQSEDDGLHWYIEPGGGVRPDQAQKLIRDLEMVSAQDGLFDGQEQSWVLPGQMSGQVKDQDNRQHGGNHT